MLVFVSCGKAKANKRCCAKDMYIGAYFKKNMTYARFLKPEHIYILSAKYGILELDDIISPYNETLNNKSKKDRKIWAFKVYQQMKQKKIDFEEDVIFLGGGKYYEYISQLFPHYKVPFKGLGINAQKGEINKIIKRGY